MLEDAKNIKDKITNFLHVVLETTICDLSDILCCRLCIIVHITCNLKLINIIRMLLMTTMHHYQ